MNQTLFYAGIFLLLVSLTILYFSSAFAMTIDKEPSNVYAVIEFIDSNTVDEDHENYHSLG